MTYEHVYIVVPGELHWFEFNRIAVVSMTLQRDGDTQVIPRVP